jgi:hypothetical protein
VTSNETNPELVCPAAELRERFSFGSKGDRYGDDD